jgi:hypothetical protein
VDAAAPDRRAPRLRFGRDALHLPNSVTLTGDQQNRVLAAVRAAIGQPARA